MGSSAAVLAWLDALPGEDVEPGAGPAYLLARARGGGLWVGVSASGSGSAIPATLKPVRVEEFAVAAEAAAAGSGAPLVARSSRMQCEPDQLERATPAFRDRLMPQLLGVPGFVGAYLLIDRASGTRFTLSLWESGDALDASEQVVAPQRAQIGEDIRVRRPVEVERFHVVRAV